MYVCGSADKAYFEMSYLTPHFDTKKTWISFCMLHTNVIDS